MELTRGQLETRAIHERDKAEIRELLENIIHSNEDMRTLLSMNSPQPVEDVMESLQTVSHTVRVYLPRMYQIHSTGTSGVHLRARSGTKLSTGTMATTPKDVQTSTSGGL